MIRTFAKYAIGVFIIAVPRPVPALTAEEVMPLERMDLFNAAKRYVLMTHLDSQTRVSPIQLDDQEAGIIRFTFRSDDFVDDSAVIEVIEDPLSGTKLRITLPKDYLGRTHLLLKKIAESAKSSLQGKGGRTLSHNARRVYRSVKRYVLKSFVPVGAKKNDVLRLDESEIGLLRFVYADNNRSEETATIQIIPLGKSQCRMLVSLSSALPAKTFLLEDRLVSSINKDLGTKDPSYSIESQ